MYGGLLMADKKKPTGHGNDKDEPPLADVVKAFGETKGTLQEKVSVRKAFKEALQIVARSLGMAPGLLLEAKLRQYLALQAEIIYFEQSEADREHLRAFLEQLGLTPPTR